MSRKHKYLASVGLDGETQPQQQQPPTRKKKDSRSFFPSQNGKTCCVFELQKDGDRVISIHAGDVLFRKV